MRSTALAAALVAAAASIASASEEAAAWKRFRDEYPYHIQTLAVSAPDEAGRRVLVISEPPPGTELERLQAAHAAEFVDAGVQRQPIGVNGWAADIVITLAPMAEARLQELVRELTAELFGTSYKAHAVKIADAPAAAPRLPLDLTVSSADLAQWLSLEAPVAARTAWSRPLQVVLALLAAAGLVLTVKTRRLAAVALAIAPGIGIAALGLRAGPPPPTPLRFTPVHGGPARTLPELFQSGAAGAFLSEERGLMLFALPRGAALDRYRIALREFALDSDLVLGAVGSPAGLAVVARERVAPVALLPPLRVETILQLAAARGDELAQSYERKHLFAGRFDTEKNRDWAPIYLSDELKDTEYGSLLNITDQLLKSWSEHGQIRYANFEYPDPESFPFPTGLMEHSQARMVTFNWNTKGVGYSSTAHGYDLLAFNRTGALPVDYLGEQDARLQAFEETGYDYFAGRSDPNLVRVVQYAGLYQTWRHFGIAAPSTGPSVREDVRTDALLPLAVQLLETVRGLPLGELDVNGGADDAELKEQVGLLKQLQEGLQAFRDEFGEKGDDDLARAVLEPRAVQKRVLSGQGTDYDKLLAQIAYALGESTLLKQLLAEQRQQVMALYYFLSAPDEQTWVHTPTLVVSWPTGPRAANVTGGHNLSARISRFSASADVPPGEIRIVESGSERTVLYSQADGARIHGTVRTLARSPEKSASEVQALLRTRLLETPPIRRTMPEALRLGDDVSGGGRGLTARHVPSSLSVPTWSQSSVLHAGHTERLTVLARGEALPIVVERRAADIVVTGAGAKHSVEAPETASALDAVVRIVSEHSGDGPRHLHFMGFEAEQARGFAESAELHLPRGVRFRTSVETATTPRRALENLGAAEWEVAAARQHLSSSGGITSLAVEVPARIPGRSVKARVVVSIQEMAAAVREKVAAVIATWMERIAALGEKLDMFLAMRDLMRDLRAIPGVQRVDGSLADEAADIFVVDGGVETAGNAAD